MVKMQYVLKQMQLTKLIILESLSTILQDQHMISWVLKSLVIIGISYWTCNFFIAIRDVAGTAK